MPLAALLTLIATAADIAANAQREGRDVTAEEMKKINADLQAAMARTYPGQSAVVPNH